MTEVGIDPEIGAMGAVATALSKLDEDQQVRVLRWAADRYGLKGVKLGSTGGGGGTDEEAAEGGTGTYNSITELFEAAQGAKTNTQKALVAGYWFQVVMGNPGFQAYSLNVELKNMGIKIANITDALGSAENVKPALLMQTAKTGKAKQARKTYKLTTVGVKAVEAMLTDAD
jgi:hypothetical protein